MNNYEFKNVRGHIEVYLNGEFQFSSDTMSEAYSELRQYWDPHFNAIEEN